MDNDVTRSWLPLRGKAIGSLRALERPGNGEETSQPVNDGVKPVDELKQKVNDIILTDHIQIR